MTFKGSKRGPPGAKAVRLSPASFSLVPLIVVLLFLSVLVIGTVRNPHFWQTADQQGEHLFAQKRYADAAKAYTDPWRIGVAQYRNGDFESAAHTFARVPGADGAFDQGNAWLMHGKYDEAIERYDRALGFRPGWKAAEENKALAVARKQLLEAAGKDAAQEQTGQDKPDQVVFDPKGDDPKGKPVEMNGEKMSDEELRATWLRRVQTTPGDFLRTKFAYQAQTAQKGAKIPKDGAR